MTDPKITPDPQPDDPEETLDPARPVDIELPFEPGDANGQPV